MAPKKYFNKKTERLLFITSLLCLVFSFTEKSFAETYSFEKDMEGWRSWGKGESGLSQPIAHNGKGSVFLDCDADEDRVLYKEINVPNGRYKISAWLRGLSIRQSRYKEGALLYYKAEDKNKGVVNFVSKKDIYGNFDWSKIEYTVDVKNTKLQLWFALKTPGKIWLDDIKIAKFSEDTIPFHFERAEVFSQQPNKPRDGNRCSFCGRWWKADFTSCPLCGEKIKAAYTQAKNKAKPKYLLNFEDKEQKEEKKIFTPEGYSDTSATDGEKAGIIASKKYNNVELKTDLQKDWQGYDYIALDIYNPTPENYKFALAISDHTTKGYWDQLNHYSTLNPGWNKMKFPLRQYVGERGSVRNKRYLDFSKIKRFWFRVDPNDEKTAEKQFFVDNIRLTQSPKLPAPFPGLFLFDFVKEKFRTYQGFIPVGTRDIYDKDTGFGFIDTHFWRAHDSLYTDQLYRDGIFVKKGHFQVDLPNGEYIVRLVPNGLGEWFEHFWTRREIEINGRSVLSEQRKNAQDYLEDFLRFQDIEPRITDNAYDLYLRKIFLEIKTRVKVTKGKVDIAFTGDDASIMLNTLIIYPISKQTEGEKFIKELLTVQRDEFANLCRFAMHKENKNNKIDAERNLEVFLLNRLALPWHTNKRAINKKGIALKAVRLQYPAQTLLVKTFNQNGEITFTASDLKTSSGEIIPLSKDSLRYGVRQYFSHSINHEAYDLVPRFFKPVMAKKHIDKNDSMLIYYQVFVPKEAKAGIYHGTIEVAFNGEKTVYPVKLEVLNSTLTETDIPVGFFGLEPVSFEYFKGKEVKKLRQQFKINSLKLLREKGFTTWTSLPPMQYQKKATLGELETKDVDQLMKTARELGFHHKVFTYGSPDSWILQKPPRNMDKSTYWLEKSRLLRARIAEKNWLPIVVDISDEATGYSKKVERDLQRAEIMEIYFPYFQRGGYTHPIKKGEYGDTLNMQLNAMSLSSITDAYRKRLKKRNIQWGRYIQATGMTDTNRTKFGLDLFLDRKQGSHHLLGWSLCLSQNYPYYDLDGREKDAMMFYPRKDGTLLSSLNFEQAAAGLEDYRLLCLLEKLLPQQDQAQIETWLKDNYLKFSTYPSQMREEVFSKLSLVLNKR